MFRVLSRAAFLARSGLRASVLTPSLVIPKAQTSIVALQSRLFGGFQPILQTTAANVQLTSVQQEQTRSVTKFSLRSGKRKSIKAVVKRFYRLHWGGWIRTIAGRHKHMWRKTAKNKYRLRQHVFVSGTQSWLLDKCVTKYWRRPKWYVDDIYEPYHTRNEHFATKNTKIYE